LNDRDLGGLAAVIWLAGCGLGLRRLPGYDPVAMVAVWGLRPIVAA